MPDFPPPPVLLDTHVWIWVMEGDDGKLGGAARGAVETAARDGRVLVSAISVWEVAMLQAKGRIRFTLDVREWIRRALGAPGVHLSAFTPEVAVDSTQLPEPLHGDPADRILVATARRTGATLVTRDGKLLEYGARGMLAVLDAAC